MNVKPKPDLETIFLSMKNIKTFRLYLEKFKFLTVKDIFEIKHPFHELFLYYYILDINIFENMILTLISS